jgi:hypothetical protein
MEHTAWKPLRSMVIYEPRLLLCKLYCNFTFFSIYDVYFDSSAIDPSTTDILLTFFAFHLRLYFTFLLIVYLTCQSHYLMHLMS